MTLGEFVKTYRLKHDLSIRAFASIAGMSPQAIGNIEKGIGNDGKPMTSTMKTYQRIAKAVGLTENELMRKLSDDVLINPLYESDEDELLAETNFLYDSPDALDLIRACMNLSGEQIHLLALIAGEMEPKSKKTAVKKHSGSGLVVSADL
jgi:transcriptional regulator with XRE-family HTH domain